MVQNGSDDRLIYSKMRNRLRVVGIKQKENTVKLFGPLSIHLYAMEWGLIRKVNITIKTS